MFCNKPAGQRLINCDSVLALKSFSEELHVYIKRGLEKGCRSVVFLCIGTDRSTGDSLGPLVGYKIADMKHNGVYVYGNLGEPVHAKNLDDVMKRISSKCNRPFVVAIDACLGKIDHVGCIGIGEGSIKPGAGVNKDLNPVGDMFITGIVNFGGFMDFLILQNTRLNVVMKIADVVSAGILYVMSKLERELKRELEKDMGDILEI